MNQGKDVAGFVEAVGEDVTEFRKGDRVAAYLRMDYGGGYAEYAICDAHAVFFLPKKTSFQEGAAIPLAALTAVIGLYTGDRLDLPQPTSPATKPAPLVVYGGSSAVGTYVLQLAKRSNIHPIIAVAGKAQDHVNAMLEPSKGDKIVDYRKGDEAVVQEIKDALQGQKLEYFYDATTNETSWINSCKVLDRQSGKITIVLPPIDEQGSPEMGGKHKTIPQSIQQSFTNVGDAFGSQADLGYLYSRDWRRDGPRRRTTKSA